MACLLRRVCSTQHACEDHVEQATRDCRPVSANVSYSRPSRSYHGVREPVVRMRIPWKVGQSASDAGVYMPETSNAATVVAIMDTFSGELSERRRECGRGARTTRKGVEPVTGAHVEVRLGVRLVHPGAFRIVPLRLCQQSISG